MSDDQAVIAAHLERYLGRAQTVRPGMIPRAVHVIPPRRVRRHWVLHTVGARAHLLEPAGAVAPTRAPEHAIDIAGKTPREGDVYFNPGDSGRACPDVFALLIARSRQLGKQAELVPRPVR